MPGGVIEPGESFTHAALREAHEEVALDRRLVHVAGALTPIDIPVSGFRLHPIVGLLDSIFKNAMTYMLLKPFEARGDKGSARTRGLIAMIKQIEAHAQYHGINFLVSGLHSYA